MKIVEAAGAGRMWPLDGPAGGMFVGGATLRDAQEELGPDEDVSLMSNCWVAREDWALLLGMAGAAKLESHDGDVLAWKGGEAVPHDGVVVLASEGSFVVRHPWDLLRVNEQVVGGLDPGAVRGARVIGTEHGVLIVGEGTLVLPGVFTKGTVIAGRDCEIGPNCFLRGSTAIGDGCHIGQAVEIKNSIIGPGTSIGHLSYVGDSVIGPRVNFGAGTIAGNLRHDGKNHRTMVEGELVDTGRRKFGTVVGEGVHTGIHTAIYPGRKLGPGTTTRPGEVVERDVG